MSIWKTRLRQLVRLLSFKRPVHCWAEGPRRLTGEWDGGWPVDVGSTCLRYDGHFGRHDFVDDAEITVAFSEADA